MKISHGDKKILTFAKIINSMLLKFYCSNFKSIKDEIELNLFSGSYKRHESHIISFKDKGILRTTAIYGNNGSGKTNILLALQFLHKLIVRGTRDINEKLDYSTFKLSDCKNIPTYFEVDFIIDRKRFNYKLSLLLNTIISEELYEIKESPVVIFKRTTDGKKTRLTIAPNRHKDSKEKMREEIYAEELRENQPFFKESINKKISETILPHSWFSNKLKFVSLDAMLKQEGFDTGLASTFLLDKDFYLASKEIIRNSNVGISDFNLVKVTLAELKSRGFELPFNLESDLKLMPELNVDFTYDGELYSTFREDGEVKFVKISTTHLNKDNVEVEFKFSEESKGVQRLFELLPAIYRSIHKGEIFILDEIETSFHPVLLKEILELYLSKNPNMSGQLIFTTHESHLLDLDLFRQDEIWFCEKDKFGVTRLYSLAEFKPRFDKDIRKGYLEGQFSQIPFLGDKNQLGI